MKHTRIQTILLCTLLATTLAQAQRDIPNIFQHRQTTAKGGAQPERSAARSRTAAIDATLFDRTSAKRLAAGKKKNAIHRARMRMNLSADNLPLTVAWEDASRTEDGKAVVWTGALENQPLSHAVFVAGEEGVTGNVSRGDGIVYQIRPIGGGDHMIREVDQKSFPAEAAPKYAPPAERSARDAVFDDDGKTIDVLVAYTPAARQTAGGEAQMRQLIQLGIAETNQGYANSGVIQRVRLAGTGEVAYQETGSLDTDLERLTDRGDGFLEEVHAVRDRAAADVVSLWVNEGDACGIGWQMEDPTRVRPELGFHVVTLECATGYFSFGHEMGHNMGAGHAREDSGGGAFPYSYGYKQTGTSPSFRTVMAYDCKGGCARVNYWSSPEARYNGKATGVNGSENNALALNNTARIVANFRSSTGGGGTPPATTGNFPESDHPYADDDDRVWTYTVPGKPDAMNVTFDARTMVEEDYDFIAIYDVNKKPIAGSPFTGGQLAGKTLTIAGDTVYIRLASDESVNDWGFKVTNIVAKGASGGGKPDLAAISLKANTTGVIGGKVGGVDAKIQNKGGAAAGEFRIGFYWINASKQAVFSGWSCSVKSLDPGATYTCGGEIGVPSSLTAGTYQLAVIADDQKQTPDADWDNNARLAESAVRLQ